MQNVLLSLFHNKHVYFPNWWPKKIQRDFKVKIKGKVIHFKHIQIKYIGNKKIYECEKWALTKGGYFFIQVYDAM